MLDDFQQRRIQPQPAIHSEDDYHQSIVGNVKLFTNYNIILGKLGLSPCKTIKTMSAQCRQIGLYGAIPHDLYF